MAEEDSVASKSKGNTKFKTKFMPLASFPAFETYPIDGRTSEVV